MFDKSLKMSFIKIAIISNGILLFIVSFVFFTSSIDFEIKFLCLIFVIIDSLSKLISFKLNNSDIFSYNFSIPILFNADILIILSLVCFIFYLKL